MARTYVYVDGFNLYYGALKANCDFFRTVHPSILAQSQFPTRIIDKRGPFDKPVTW